jgi:hypothetical protein
VLLGAVTLLAVVALIVVLGVRPFGLGRTEFAKAVASAPAGTERVSWTDWAGVRRELGSAVTSRSSTAEVQAFLDDGADADLTSRSALLQSAPHLQELFGFSPASVEWELFSQSHDGAVITLRLPDSIDLGDIANRLEDLGFPRPGSDTGVWAGGPDLLSTIAADLTPELAYLVLDADDHLILASDQQRFLETAFLAATGDGERVDGLDAVVGAVGEPLSAAVYSGDYACGALAMGNADAEDQAQAVELVAAAGTVDPYLAFAMAMRPEGDVRVAMEFANDDQARDNADSRAVLATGPAVGQGGDFAERFALRSASADGSVVVLDLDPVEGEYVLGDLSSGPVLFATC